MKKLIFGTLFTVFGILTYTVFQWKNIVGAIFLALGILLLYLFSFNRGSQDFHQGKLLGKLLMGFGLLCLLTAFALGLLSEGKIVSHILSPDNMSIGPLTVEKDRTIFQIIVKQQVEYGHWSAISGEITDAAQNVLFSFGDELWAETGYDEGTWYESKTDYDNRITLQKGEYHIRFACECSKPPCKNPIVVHLQKKTASGVPFIVPGTLSLILGILLWLCISTKQNIARFEEETRKKTEAARRRQQKKQKAVKSGSSDSKAAG